MIHYVEDFRLISALHDQLSRHVDPELHEGRGRNVLKATMRILERLKVPLHHVEELMTDDVADIADTLVDWIEAASDLPEVKVEALRALLDRVTAGSVTLEVSYECAQEALNELIRAWSAIGMEHVPDARLTMHHLLTRSAERALFATDPYRGRQ